MVCFHPILTWTKRDNLASKKYYPLSLNCLARCRAEFWCSESEAQFKLAFRAALHKHHEGSKRLRDVFSDHRQNHSIRNGRKSTQIFLQIPELDAVAVDFDLSVDSPFEKQKIILYPSPIASAIGAQISQMEK